MIKLLDPSVAEKIAAGEVIERPASVVKELVENSLDAGATEVRVLLEDGGKSLIEVLDNGFGMSASDLALSIQRHATSKLSTIQELETLHSLGFRGEALASIAAVTDISLLSTPQDGQGAYEIRGTSRNWSGPEPVTFGDYLGSPHGTRIQARGLFSQVPARLKFLKSQGAEVSQVRDWMERLAASHPQTGFRLLSETKTIFSVRSSSEAARIRAVLTDNSDSPMISVTEGPMRLHWLQGVSLPQARKIIQVVNGRATRDRMIQQAILGAFRQLLLPGQFPAIGVFIEVNPSELDVNVHPTKSEVRFLNSGKIFSAIHALVGSLVNRHGAPVHVPSSHPRFVFQARDTGAQAEPTSWLSPTLSDMPSSPPPPTDLSLSQTEPPAVAAPESNGLGFSPGNYVGSLFNTYLLFDLGQELGLLDQHAAHERIRYEELHSRFMTGEIHSQALLIPESVPLPPSFNDNPQGLEKTMALLNATGFDVEGFGDQSLLFRGVPAGWGDRDLRVRLRNLVGRVTEPELLTTLDAQSVLQDERMFEALASQACHSSVRAGDKLETLEAQTLLKRLFQCKHPWNCPHGRPTLAKVPRARLEEWFLRRV
ncbi:DNA mismatch repair endonuclease MutL [Bdellovibrionota bacterium FG-2]